MCWCLPYCICLFAIEAVARGGKPIRSVGAVFAPCEQSYGNVWSYFIGCVACTITCMWWMFYCIVIFVCLWKVFVLCCRSRRDSDAWSAWAAVPFSSFLFLFSWCVQLNSPAERDCAPVLDLVLKYTEQHCSAEPLLIFCLFCFVCFICFVCFSYFTTLPPSEPVDQSACISQCAQPALNRGAYGACCA